MTRKEKHAKKRSRSQSGFKTRNHQYPFWICEAIAGGLLIIGYMLSLFPIHKKFAVGIFFTAWVLVGLGVTIKLWHEFSTESKPKGKTSKVTSKFSAVVEGGWVRPKSMDEGFWMLVPFKSPAICPINGMIHLRFTNLSKSPIMIDSYEVELRFPERGWTKLTTMYLTTGRQFFGRGPTDDFTQAKQARMEDRAFDSIIANKEIDPGHIVRGWVFLETIERSEDTNFLEARFRVNGNLVEPLIGLKEKSIQPITIKMGESADLSKVSRQYYSNVDKGNYK